jgi:hypothetical protein
MRSACQRQIMRGYVDATLGAGTSAAVANGFTDLDSPYNADIPYDINQLAAFGEASYDFGQFKLTAGARYYDFEEERDFISGGLFSPMATIALATRPRRAASARASSPHGNRTGISA